MTVDTSFAGDY